MTSPMQVEDEIAQLDFEPRCERIHGRLRRLRCERAAAAMVDIHGHSVPVGLDTPWRRMFMCSECLDLANQTYEKFAAMAARVGYVPCCTACQEEFPKLSDFIPLVRPL